MTTANNRSSIVPPAAATSMASRNTIVAATAALDARYPYRVTPWVTARNTTAATAAEAPVGCHTIVMADATAIPTAIPATRPTQRVYVCAVSGRNTTRTVSGIQ